MTTKIHIKTINQLIHVKQIVISLQLKRLVPLKNSNFEKAETEGTLNSFNFPHGRIKYIVEQPIPPQRSYTQ